MQKYLERNIITEHQIEMWHSYFNQEKSDISIDLSGYSEVEISALSSFQNFLRSAESLEKFVIFTVTENSLKIQFDFLRLHRRVLILAPTLESDETVDVREEIFLDEEINELLTLWRDDIDKIVDLLESEHEEDAADLIHWIVENEDELFELNQVTPQKYLLPKIVSKFSNEKLANILEYSKPVVISKFIFNDFQKIDLKQSASILNYLSPEKTGTIISHLSDGIDFPSQIVTLLALMEETKIVQVLNHISPSVLGRSIALSNNFNHASHVVSLFSFDNTSRLINYILRQNSPERFSFAAAFLSILDDSIKSKVLEGLEFTDRKCLGEIFSEGRYELHNTQWLKPELLSRFVSGVGKIQQYENSIGKHFEINEVIDFPNGRKKVQSVYVAIDDKKFCIKPFGILKNRSTLLPCLDFVELKASNSSPGLRELAESGFFYPSHKKNWKDISGEAPVVLLSGGYSVDETVCHGESFNSQVKKTLTSIKMGWPVGLYVEEGRILQPALFNRCAFIVNRDGECFIERVVLEGIKILEHDIRWECRNEHPLESQVSYYTSSWGYHTPKRNNVVELTIVDGKVIEKNRGGESVIPLLGFVVSVPLNAINLNDVGLDDSVEYFHSFSHGEMYQALACGPQLISNGQIDLDFNLEEFYRPRNEGPSVNLPKCFETYEGSRSFIGIRHDGKIVMGTVAGRALGMGAKGLSCGMTFGELTQLVSDLGLQNAMSLEGGAKSSLIIRTEDDIEWLHTPTGGQNLVRGEEALVSHCLAVVPKKSSG